VAPIEYIPIMRAYYESLGRGEYPIYEPQGCPWTPPRKPLRETRLAIVCSAGISTREQRPFHRRAQDDFSIREIPVDIDPAALVINYDYFDHSDADRDINCLLPLTRLRELVADGYLGSLAPRAYTMGIGRWGDASTPVKLEGAVAAELARRCHGEGVDAVLLVPG
jgi:D-proline reductase (dithiol) PrdB